MDHNDIVDILAVRLLGLVPEDEEIVISSNKGNLVVLDPKSKAGEAFRRIARRLEGEDVPLMDLEPRGILDKIKNFMGFNTD